MQKILRDGFAELNLNYNDEMQKKFRTFFDYLEERNAVMNLTAIRGEEDVAKLHFLDCAALCSIYDFKQKNVIDIGTGAGFPSVPLKIAEPSIKLTSMDSQQKRITFLTEAFDKLSIDDVRIECARAEEFIIDTGATYDIAVSRAVARLNVLCELCLPFVSVGGVFIAMKGPGCSEELTEAENAIKTLGGGNTRIEKYKIPGTDIVHSAVIIEKINNTPKKYPRQFGKIKNSPL